MWHQKIGLDGDLKAASDDDDEDVNEEDVDDDDTGLLTCRRKNQKARGTMRKHLMDHHRSSWSISRRTTFLLPYVYSAGLERQINPNKVEQKAAEANRKKQLRSDIPTILAPIRELVMKRLPFLSHACFR
jgi:integrase